MTKVAIANVGVVIAYVGDEGVEPLAFNMGSHEEP
jgi:hypothetical protein